MRTALRDALLEIKEEDDGLYLIVGDIGFGVFEEFEKKYKKDYLNIGICEAEGGAVCKSLRHEFGVSVSLVVCESVSL